MSPSPHATPPSDAHTEQHSPVDGGEGGSGGGEDEEAVAQQAPQLPLVVDDTEPMYSHAAALPYPRPQSESDVQ